MLRDKLFIINIMSLRSSKIRALASHLDMQYFPTDEWGMNALLQDFRLFKRGRRKTIENVIRSVDQMLETEVNVFDYRYTVSSGKSTKTHKQTVFFVRSKNLALPEFLMKPETILHQMGEWLNFTQDIDFVDFPEFSKQYLLQGEDEEYIRYKMTPQVLRYFTVEKNWTLEGVNYFLIFYQNRKLLEPSQIRNFYRKGMAAFSMLKEKELL
ncbi:MAG: hypothetical protein AB8G22_12180 [Saprospiraceae bacterium]